MSLFWWLIVALALVALYLAYRLLAAPPVAASGTGVGINNVTLSITPRSNPCDGTSMFTCVVGATGWSDDGVSRNVRVALFDEDPVSDDELDSAPATGATPLSTVFAMPLPLRGPYLWTFTHTFTTLYCDTSCNVTGPSGSSGESVAEIYAWLKVLHGSQPELESQRVSIGCTAG